MLSGVAGSGSVVLLSPSMVGSRSTVKRSSGDRSLAESAGYLSDVVGSGFSSSVMPMC